VALRRNTTLWRLAAAALAIGGVYAGCKLMPASPESAEGTTQPPVAAAAQQQALDERTEQERPLPVLNAEALTARVEAQRALLGSRGLFEDADGNPVPWLSPQEVLPEDAAGDDEQSIDDDLLNSLPGSSGLVASDTLLVSSSSPRSNGNALGLFEAVESSTDAAPLEHFHDALRELRAGRDPDGKVRVLMYGASHTDADVYPHYLRTYLQQRFGDGGHGFVHVAKPWRWYGHVDVAVEGGARWKTEHAQRRDARADGYFGLLGASLATRDKKASGRVTFRNGTVASNFEIYFLAQPRGGSFTVFADGREIATVKTAAAEPRAGYYAFELPEAEHEIEVRPRGNGEIRLFGMTAERLTQGVVVDTLGIGGTRASNILRWDEAVWADNVRRRAPDLYVLAYGTNEATDEQPIGVYEADLRAVIERFARAAPEASCLLVGPGDFPMQTEQGSFAPRPRVSEIVQAQARVAAELGCGFWDTLAFMGGDLSMVQWANAVPPMAKSDHIHLTRRGYVRMGMALTDAMMLEFDGDVLSGHAWAKPRQ
jgi:lysophospholipase L1-like esterase